VFATGNHLETLYGQVVFSAGSQEYCWEDVVLAAELWGDWTRVRGRLRQGLACLRASEERDTGPDDPDLESAATEFRYVRDLVSAEEMEAWLARWNLTAEGWMDYVRWSLLSQMWSDELADLVSKYSPEKDEEDRLLLVEAVCSGDLDRFARELAGRVAVSERETSREPDDAEIAEVLREFPTYLTEGGLSGVASEACRAKMERLARVEVSFRRFQEEGATPRRIAALIRSRRIDWTRLDLDSVSFPRSRWRVRRHSACAKMEGASAKSPPMPAASFAGRRRTSKSWMRRCEMTSSQPRKVSCSVRSPAARVSFSTRSGTRRCLPRTTPRCPPAREMPFCGSSGIEK